MVAVAAALFLFTAFFTKAAGTTYYMRTDGNDSFCTGRTDAGWNNISSAGQPCAFRNLHTAFNAVTSGAGDTIIVKAGTHTGNLSQQTCGGGGTYTMHGKLSGKSDVTVRGERNPLLPSNDPDGLLSVFDGQFSTKGIIAVCNSDRVTFEDLKFMNYAGDTSRSITYFAPFGVDASDDFKWHRNAIIDPNVDGLSGAAGELSIDDGFVRGEILDSYFASAYPIIISVQAPGGQLINSQNAKISGNFIDRIKHFNGTSPANIRSIFTRRITDIQITDNYIVDTATDPYTQSNQGIILRETKNALVARNVIRDIQGSNVSYLYHQDDTDPASSPCRDNPANPSEAICNERHTEINNTFHRSNAGSAVPVFVVLNCNGCTFENNLFLDDISGCGGLEGIHLIGSGTDLLTGVPTMIDYNFFHSVDRPFPVAGTSYQCGASSCATTKRCDLDPPLFRPDLLPSTNDKANTANNVIVASGNVPAPYYALSASVAGTKPIDNGNNAFCNGTPLDGDGNGFAICDMGAYELSGGGGGAPAPNAGPDVNTSSTAVIVLSGSATDSDGNMTSLSWSVAPAGCTVAQGAPPAFPAGSGARSLTLSNCADGTYVATLTAVDPGASNSDAATVRKDTVAPAPVPIPTAALGGTQVDLSWSTANDAVSGVRDYRVWRSINGGTYAALGYVTGASYSDTATSPNTTYQYKISTRDNFYNESSQGIASNLVTTGNTVTVVFQQGVYPTAGYAGTIDNVMQSEVLTTNLGAATAFNSGRNSAADTRRGLLKFDLAPGSIPPAANILSATLELTCDSGFSGANTTYLYRARPGAVWAEMNSSWNNRDVSAPWVGAGASDTSTSGDRLAVDSGNALVPISCAGGTKISFAVSTTTVAVWTANTPDNNGFVLVGTESGASTARAFRSSEYATASDRPKLTIVYEPPGGSLDTTLPTAPTNLRVTGISKLLQPNIPAIGSKSVLSKLASLAFVLGEKIIGFIGMMVW